MKSEFFTQAPAVKDILAKQKAKTGEDPDRLLILPENAGTEYIEELVLEFAKINYEKRRIPRRFENCFLLMKYPKETGEQNQFFASPRIVCQYYNNFEGTFGIEVTDYLRLVDTPEFRRLEDYIEMKDKDINFILLACAREESAAAYMYSVLKKKVRIKMENIKFADAKVFSNYALELLSKNDVIHTKEFGDLLTLHIETLSQEPLFLGFETVSRVVKDIVYELQPQKAKCLTAADFLLIKETCLTIDKGMPPYGKMGFSI